MTISQELIAFLTARCWTQQRIASACGLSQGYLSKVVRQSLRGGPKLRRTLHTVCAHACDEQSDFDALHDIVRRYADSRV